MATYTITLEPSVDESVRRRAALERVSIEDFLGNAVKQLLDTNKTIVEDPVEQSKSGREILEELRREGALFRTNMTEGTEEFAQKLRERSQRRNRP